MMHRTPSLNLVAITALLISVTADAGTVSIAVPELVFNAADKPATNEATASIANAGPVSVAVPGLVFSSGEEPMANAPVAPPASVATIIQVPGLQYGNSEKTPAAGSSSDSGGPLVIRTGGLRFATGNAAAAAADGSTDMNYTTFDTGPVSGALLSADAATVSIDQGAAIRYQGLPPEGRHRLRAWLVSESEPRIYREQSTTEGETSGNWQPELAVAGDYQVCIALAGNTAPTRRAPQHSDECVAITAAWGDPSNPPQPVVETTPVEPVAGKSFELSYRGMPKDANAKIFIYESGAPRLANAAADVATRGKTSDTTKLRLYDAGNYEIRIIFERMGRQTRATRTLRVIPAPEETSQ